MPRGLTSEVNHQRGARRARLVRAEDGASIVEYAFLLALIALLCLAAISLLGNKISTFMSILAGSL
jgi:pilus assembly protein Flp/PilA